MSDNGINKYPSAAIQQCPTKIAFLIDCDGGLSAAFYQKRTTVIEPNLIKEFPSNSDIFLFFNSNDSSIADRMKKLASDNDNVYSFPTIIRNSRNGADMSLSFMLGVINDKYDDYFIIIRNDRAYDEIKERLKNMHPHLKNHVQLNSFDGPRELAQYVRKLDNFQNEGQFKSSQNTVRSRAGTTSPIAVKFTSENIFWHCPLETFKQSSCLYRFKELLHHLDDKHPEVHYQYCLTCEEMVQRNDRSEDWRFEQHLQKEHRENDAGFHLSIRYQ